MACFKIKMLHFLLILTNLLYRCQTEGKENIGKPKLVSLKNNLKEFVGIERSSNQHSVPINGTIQCNINLALIQNLNPNLNSNLPEDESNLRIVTGLPGTNFQDICSQNVGDRCFFIPSCNTTAPYRTYDGSCNNLLFPMWGLTNTALVRLVPARYEDGLHMPRLSVSGKVLPGPREISLKLNSQTAIPSHINTLTLMQWGQIISHDTSEISPIPVLNLGPVQCCKNDTLPPLTDLPAICLPIEIPNTDPYFSYFKQTCINFVRAPTTTDYGCSLVPQQQIAMVTHFIDASFLYGSTEADANSLRTFSHGLMDFQLSNGNTFLPLQENDTTFCYLSSTNKLCYRAGDNRVNQNTGVTIMHTLFLRYHNLLCFELKKINSYWDDEKLYQEARRIVIAAVQRITYTDFLTALLGVVLVRECKEYGIKNRILDIDFLELYNGYEQLLNPTTINEFATVAYRSLHNIIPSDMDLVDEGRCLTDSLLLSNWFFRPSIIQQAGILDNLIRGLATQSSDELSEPFSPQVYNKLFIQEAPHGNDLAAVDIQRTRDHGIAPYNEFRSACGLPKASNFSDFIDTIDEENINLLVSIYNDVNDVDFYVAGLLERHVDGALTGPTFQCILGEQFVRWRNGDRFYYEFSNQSGSFTPAQFKELQKLSLGLLFCETGDDIRYMQGNVFLRPGTQNELMPCSSFPRLDFSPWIELP